MELISRIVIIFKYGENPFMELLFIITLIKWIIQEHTKNIFRIFFSHWCYHYSFRKKRVWKGLIWLSKVFFFFFSGACNLTECNQNCATINFFRFCNLLFRVLKLNRSHTLATVPRFVTSLIMSLGVPVCNIKRILCSDRQPERARWAWDCPLWSCARKRRARSRLTEIVILGQCRWWSRKKREK